MAWREGRDGPPPATQGQASLSLPPPFPLTSAFQSSRQPRLRLAGGGAGAREELHGGGGQEAGRAEFVHGGGQRIDMQEGRRGGGGLPPPWSSLWRGGENFSVDALGRVARGQKCYAHKLCPIRCVRCGAWAHNCFKFPGQNTEHIQTPEFGFDNSKLAIPSPAQAQFIHPNTGYVFSYK